MAGSTDAIAHVQEGIVVDVNPAWVELFGYEDAGALLGQPLMDFFHQRSHAALKGALVAAAQGRWTDHSLASIAVLPGGSELAMDLEFERFEFEGEPAVRVRVPTQKRDLASLTSQLEEALRFDTSTGLLKRAAFLDQGAAQAAHLLKAGIRAVAYLEPDRLATLESRTRARSPSRTSWTSSAPSCAASCSRATSPAAYRRAGSPCWSSAATRATSTPGCRASCSASPNTCSSRASIAR